MKTGVQNEVRNSTSSNSTKQSSLICALEKQSFPSSCVSAAEYDLGLNGLATRNAMNVILSISLNTQACSEIFNVHEAIHTRRTSGRGGLIHINAYDIARGLVTPNYPEAVLGGENAAY